MRVVLVLLMLLGVSPAWAQAPGEAAAIESVIGDQIEAFRRDDGVRAFGLASPMIQGMFQTPETFMAMVAHGYPPVFRPREVRYGALVTVDGVLTQQVHLIGPDGRAYLALYAMEKQADGSWKINGCELTEDESVGA